MERLPLQDPTQELRSARVGQSGWKSVVAIPQWAMAQPGSSSATASKVLRDPSYIMW